MQRRLAHAVAADEKLKNGDLLTIAEAYGFECLVTCDRNLSYQQNMTARKIALVVLPSGNWPLIQMKMPEIVAAINDAEPNSFQSIPRAMRPKPRGQQS